MKKLVVAGVLALASLVASQAAAGAITFTYIAGNGASATAKFEVSGGNTLKVTLTNTGSVVNTGQISEAYNGLGAVLFNVSGNPALTPSNIDLGAGSQIIQGAGPYTDEDLGDGWRYDTLTAPRFGATRVITGAGYGLPFTGSGQSNFGVTPPTKPLDGSDWLIVPSAYVAGTGAGNFATRPEVRNSIVFYLSGLPSNFDPASGIGNVYLMYGTANDLTSNQGGPASAVPEPTTLVLLGGGLLGLALRRRR